MSLETFTLPSGERIAVRPASVEVVLEYRGKTKTSHRANIRNYGDDKGWDIKESFDDVVDRLNKAEVAADAEPAEVANDV